MSKKKLLQAKLLGKSFKQGTKIIQVLKDANFELFENEIVALVGPSGCGKTTFLHVIGLLDLPDNGDIIIDDKNFVKVSDKQRTLYRRNNIGFVYQSHNLLNDFTALENVILPLRLHRISIKEGRKHAENLLRKLGLHNRADHYPTQLSGGEQQRVAIARSLVHDPKIILADEPTGNLDQDNATKVLNLLFTTMRKLKKSLVIVTHNNEIAKLADRVVTIKNGKLTTRI
ncbi:MAG: ABC transporter ATP-binding protein [Rickettsiales bacterium]|nr:ABC transporter ATP-binding protein [Rickettsiales bacterium]